MKNLFFLFLLVLLASSCSDEAQAEQEVQKTPEDQQAASQPEDFYPSFPFDTLKYLWENCDYIDVLYYDLPASMSIADSNSIHHMLSIIAAAPAPRKPNCKPIGRLFFQVDGENKASADLYFSDGCQFFVFMENEKPRWGNLITDRGITYFQNNIGQILEMSKGITPQNGAVKKAQ